jgi:hypothetical protein
MRISETIFNKILYLAVIPLLIINGVIVNSLIIIIISLFILLYHMYSDYTLNKWPFNSCDNPDSICLKKKHPIWTEYLSILGALILLNNGIDNNNIFFLILGSIFGLAHFRQLIISDNNYYTWML